MMNKYPSFRIPPCQAGIENSCRQEIDLVLESKDGIQFGAHSVELAVFSDAFPAVGAGIIMNEVVRMTEEADIVLLLLQFTHRQRWIRSDRIPFGVLHRLAEAAEKYCIFSLMEICRIQMQASALKYPLEVFIYASKHGYDYLLDLAAPGTLDLPFESTLRRLREYPSTCISWVSFRQKYVQASVHFYSREQEFDHRCIYFTTFWSHSIPSLAAKPLSEKVFVQVWHDEFSTLRYCKECNKMLPKICQWMQAELAKARLPSFTKEIAADRSKLTIRGSAI